MRRFVKGVQIVAAALVLAGAAGCMPQLIPSPPPAPSTFDFGPLRADAPEPLPLRIELATLDAPSWLEGIDILYRRLDEQPGALRAYAQSQWVATAPELLAQRLRYRLTQAAPDESARTLFLHVEILSFEQVFVAADEAYVIARARATLEDEEGRIFSRELEGRRQSPPQVEGATRELPAVADDLIDAVMQWLREVEVNSQS